MVGAAVARRHFLVVFLHPHLSRDFSDFGCPLIQARRCEAVSQPSRATPPRSVRQLARSSTAKSNGGNAIRCRQESDREPDPGKAEEGARTESSLATEGSPGAGRGVESLRATLNRRPLVQKKAAGRVGWRVDGSREKLPEPDGSRENLPEPTGPARWDCLLKMTN